jgi:hypothetical protein
MSMTKEVKATAKGTDGLPIFKPAGVQTSNGVNPEAAIDGKRSTFFHGRDLQINLGGIAAVKTIGLKLGDDAKPERFHIGKQTTGEAVTVKVDRSRVKDNGFIYYVFSKPATTSFVKVESTNDDMAIITMQLYDADVRDEVKPPEVPESPTTEPKIPLPAEPDSPATKDGAKPPIPVKLKGAYKYDVREDWRDGGARFNLPAAGTSLISFGYFKASKDGKDEVSFKPLGGQHTGDGKNDKKGRMGTIYDLGAAVGGGRVRMRAEGPHPDYTDTLDNYEFAGSCQSIVGKRKGFCCVVIQESEGVRILYFQDQGDNETKPANQWVKIYEYFDDGNKIKGIAAADLFPIRDLDHAQGTEQNTWRIDETPGLTQKWIAIAEIEGKN